MPKSNYLRNKQIDHVFRNRAYTVPATVYVALYTTSPTNADTGTEVTGGSYARVQVGPSDTAWTATQGGTPAAASSGTTGLTSNATVVQFVTPTANWGTVTHVGVRDALTAGNLLYWEAVTPPQAVNVGGPGPSFAAGQITITET